MHALIADEYIIHNCLTRDETTLMRIDNVAQDVFESISYGSDDDFVGNITKTNRSEILHGVSLLFLWD